LWGRDREGGIAEHLPSRLPPPLTPLRGWCAMKKRVGILISGRGSNMMALIEAARAPDYPAEADLFPRPLWGRDREGGMAERLRSGFPPPLTPPHVVSKTRLRRDGEGNPRGVCGAGAP